MFYSTMSRRHTVSHPPPYGSPNAGYGIAVEADCSTQWSCAASRGSDDDHNDNRGPSSYYYKDKPPKRHPPFRLDLSDPWTLASLAVANAVMTTPKPGMLRPMPGASMF